MSDSDRMPQRSLAESGDAGNKERASSKGEEHKRSRSPGKDRREDKPRRKDAGFKWKEKRRDENEPRRDRDEGLKRGYRDHYRPRSRSRSPRRESEKKERDTEPRNKAPTAAEKFEKKEKDKKKAVPTAPQQEMILVTVNDRLGTKKQIPCLPSDTIKDFKTVVAMMIGRRPHEILLKRQSERPFKDFLTLQDYGISNNVQIDLEVDTGD